MLVVVVDLCLRMVDFDFFVVDLAPCVVERAFDSFASRGVLRLMLNCSCGTIQNIFSQRFQIWPFFVLDVINWTFDGEAKIGKIFLLRFVFRPWDEMPILTLLVEVKETSVLGATIKSMVVKLIRKFTSLGLDDDE